MIDPKQIPDAVVDALLDTSNVSLPWKHAIAAALAAWPEVKVCAEDDLGPACIVLPLPEAERIAKQEENDHD